MEPSPEERQQIYLEEKARLEAREQLQPEKAPKKRSWVKRAFWIFFAFVFVMAMLETTKERPPINPKPVAALSSVKLEYQYSKSRFNVLYLNFTVSNYNSHPVWDYTITCKQYGASGTPLGTISKKVYSMVEAEQESDHDGFIMGLVDSQTELVNCEITDFVAG
jgi:hypothetical protein